MGSKRIVKVLRVGQVSLAAVLPRDWARGNSLKAGDPIEIEYDETVVIRSVK